MKQANYSEAEVSFDVRTGLCNEARQPLPKHETSRPPRMTSSKRPSRSDPCEVTVDSARELLQSSAVSEAVVAETATSVNASTQHRKPRAAFACTSWASSWQVQEKFEERDLQVHYVTEVRQDEQMRHSKS